MEQIVEPTDLEILSLTDPVEIDVTGVENLWLSDRLYYLDLFRLLPLHQQRPGLVDP